MNNKAMIPAGSGGTMGSIKSSLRYVLRGDIVMALALVFVLAMLILPLSPFILDLMLAISITFSVLILMTVMFIDKPLEFSSFPTILLISTLLRLSLNLASTRLILGHGHEGTDAAGQVIKAFGEFVVGGDYIIGTVVFAILVIVNFVVITKGSGRIAEVAARFTLDAMPGKQMAIDADLSAGLIEEGEARKRRKELESESSFFGAMDGAAKFVRGDAIAGLLITFINIIGGIIIGSVVRGMPVGEAAKVYTILTIGDGLVAQIPALIVSTAAGMLVSKAGVAGSADKAVLGQLSAQPNALGLSSFLMLSLGLVPGMPFLPFLALSLITGGLAFNMRKKRMKNEATAQKEQDTVNRTAPLAEEPISTTLAIDNIRLELGYGLLILMNAAEGSRLTDQIRGLRRQLAGDMGFILPPVRIQDNLQLAANHYVIRIKEIVAGRGEIMPNMLLCMDPKGEKITISGHDTTEPTFGLPAMWIENRQREEAMFKGYTVVDPSTVITTHLTEVVKDNMSDMLSYSETQKLLDELPKENQKLVADVVPSQITVGGLQRVLQNLIAERVSIRDLATILEGIAEAAGYTRNLTLITEHVRSRMARQLSDANTNPQGIVPLLTLSPEWEQSFAESLVGDSEEKQLSMAPSRLQQFIQAVRQAFERHAMMGESPVLLTSPTIRPYVRSIIERFRPQTIVMSQNEIHPKAKIKTLGQV
jgi:flagellar biosynthesis protein FlhA